MEFENGGYEGRPKIAIPTAEGTLVATVNVGEYPDYHEFEICMSGRGQDRLLALVGTFDGTNGLTYARAYDEEHDEPTTTTHCLKRGDTNNITDSRGMTEDKAGLVATLNLALAANDPSRYGYLLERPIELIASKDGCHEFLVQGDLAWNVSGNSPAAVMETMGEALADGAKRFRTSRAEAEALISSHDEREERC